MSFWHLRIKREILNQRHGAQHVHFVLEFIAPLVSSGGPTHSLHVDDPLYRLALKQAGHQVVWAHDSSVPSIENVTQILTQLGELDDLPISSLLEKRAAATCATADAVKTKVALELYAQKELSALYADELWATDPAIDAPSSADELVRREFGEQAASEVLGQFDPASSSWEHMGKSSDELFGRRFRILDRFNRCQRQHLAAGRGGSLADGDIVRLDQELQEFKERHGLFVAYQASIDEIHEFASEASRMTPLQLASAEAARISRLSYDDWRRSYGEANVDHATDLGFAEVMAWICWRDIRAVKGEPFEGASNYPVAVVPFGKAALRELQRACRYGRVKFTGRRNGIGPHETIPCEFWVSAKGVQPGFSAERELEICLTDDFDQPGVFWTHLRAEKQSVFEYWPNDARPKRRKEALTSQPKQPIKQDELEIALAEFVRALDGLDASSCGGIDGFASFCRKRRPDRTATRSDVKDTYERVPDTYRQRRRPPDGKSKPTPAELDRYIRKTIEN